MINIIWALLIAVGVIVGAVTDKMDAVTKAAIDSANTAVELSLGLIGVMALWLGLMKIAEEAGLVRIIGRMLKPIMTRLFPDVPPEHPAMGAMILNIAANMLGLGNAATPLGLKAMKELQTLNPKKDTATNAMCTFLAINTASVQLIPASTIALMVASGSKNPTVIIGTTLLATIISTTASIITVKILEKLPIFKP
ncbi:MAG: spore maturation protein [Thermoanaerobacteraceae bacterium]|uniref:Nucleoside recognition protein n=1 Tax=Biomaibacter acetigenes TaxID=2316383 RepID=A0A3G2R3A9_9FIRM|nr:nucleoside recognition domain-containing protein [Biomaibacter acetigenes]AYO29849.1 nucleoside recognition protein [Biomaibacter acetigenes]MDK2877984.1 spore maturation protein [Thermoanaerobacteraceae bacterium]MDN5311296.1 spore maturation protein [Thermoanaerobacteraceae bacterium]